MFHRPLRDEVKRIVQATEMSMLWETFGLRTTGIMFLNRTILGIVLGMLVGHYKDLITPAIEKANLDGIRK